MIRLPLDAYYTPDDVAQKCVAVLGSLYGLDCLEPSAGGGAFCRAIAKAGGMIHAVDVNPDAPAFVHLTDRCTVMDYKQFNPTWRPDWVIGNPPFSEAEEHVRHTFGMVRPAIGTAFLLRLAMLESAKREAFWRLFPPAEVHVLTRRPSFTGGGTDSAAYGFFVWRAGFNGTTALRWISA